MTADPAHIRTAGTVKHFKDPFPLDFHTATCRARPNSVSADNWLVIYSWKKEDNMERTWIQTVTLS
jgi:hypothetical protein